MSFFGFEHGREPQSNFIAPLEPEQIATELTIHAFKHAGSNYLSDDSIDVEDAAAFWQTLSSDDGGSRDFEMPSVIPVSDTSTGSA